MADTDTVVTETTDTTDDETTDEDTTDGDTTDGDNIIASEDCQQLVQASASLSQAFAAAGGADPDAEEASELFDEWADEAPDEIRADLEVLAQAYATYVEALDEVDFSSGTPSTDDLAELQAALATIDQEAVTEASTNLSEWSTENC